LPVFFSLAFALCTVPAAAHPLGNFTINHLAKIDVKHTMLRVRYVLDIAEIPTFQIMNARAGQWTSRAMQAWAAGQAQYVNSALHISANGTPVSLHVQRASARLRPGAGGLPILYWVGEFESPLKPHRTYAIAVQDTVYVDRRIGWKDIVVGSQSEPTHELQRYPSALIGTPQRVTAATFTVAPGGAVSSIHQDSDTQPTISSGSSIMRPTLLSDMFARPNQTPALILLTLLAAFGLGALHAIEPGHGKALLAFTLVGARATNKQALTLAGSLTFAHTFGVLLLGLALFAFAGFVSESVYPWITVVSGAAIAFIGARTLSVTLSLSKGDPAITPGAAHEHAHSVPGSQPLRFSNAVWAAMSGGVAPCPAAIVVLLAALRLHHVGYGMLLIVVFSIGLASVLSGLGLLVVHGAAWISQRSAYARFAAYGPLLTATVISIIGAVTLAQGLTQQGVLAPTSLLAALTLTAILGYALTHRTHPHTHTHLHVHPTEASPT